MKITIGQSEIEAAVKTYILSIMTLAEGANIDVDFSATRGPDGLTANINVLPPEIAEKAKEEQVALAREPEPVTGPGSEQSKPTGRKPKTLAVEQKTPENASTAQEEEVATTVQTTAQDAASEQQAASGDSDDKVDAVATTGFPGFENENQDEGGVTGAGTADQAEKLETTSNEAGATTTAAEAQGTTRKSLFGGLSRPSNH